MVIKNLFVNSLCYCILFLFLNPTLVLANGNTTIESFNNAKKLLEKKVYYDHRITLYCGYEFDEHKNIKLPSTFITNQHKNRAHKVEWEHCVPAENFGRIFIEWREGHSLCIDNRGKNFKGRKCAEKINKRFRFMQSDMYNLYPTVGAVNASRSNKRYSELPNQLYSFGTCEAKIYENRFEPPDRAKGQVARAALYMNDVYPEFHLSDQQRKLFEVWNLLYPVDEWECIRTKRIEELQGNENSIVKKMCINKGLWK